MCFWYDDGVFFVVVRDCQWNAMTNNIHEVVDKHEPEKKYK